MGYEYEILFHVARQLHLKLVAVPFDNRNDLNQQLLAGNGHLIADFRTISNTAGSRFIYSKPHTWSHLSLVQRLDPATMRVESIYDLDETTIHVQQNSIAYKKLIYFIDEYALNVRVIATKDSREELLEKVSKSEYDFTVIENEIIAVNEQFFQNLDFSLQLSFPYRVSFAFNSFNTELRDTIDCILDSFLLTPEFEKIVNKYISGQSKLFHRKVNLLLLNGSKISKIDNILKSESQKIGWDWRLLASLIMQESRFNAYAAGGGAYGLMQFMPRTGAKYGVFPNSTPEEQVAGGVAYLHYLNSLFSDVPNISQRVKFILASYNGGPSHVLDAKRVAAYFEEDYTNWDDIVSNYFLKLNESAIYQLEVVKGGAYRGAFTNNYVNEVIERFQEYQEIYPE
jgi:membrane-bound lytic murein transglycosylase F